MEHRPSVRHGLSLGLIFVGIAWAWPAVASAAPLDLFREAEKLEDQGRWFEAVNLYETILREDRNAPEVRGRLQNCWRHIQQVRRHRDPAFRKQVLSLSMAQALNVYTEVLVKLQGTFVDRAQAQPRLLFQNGIEELNQALADETFLQEHLPAVNRATLKTFRMELRDLWLRGSITSARDAGERLQGIALAARQSLGLKPTVSVFEFVCGACNALDEYTVFLTAAQLQEETALPDADLVGVGLDLQKREQKLLVTLVAQAGPAAMAGLKKADQLLRIDHKAAADLTADAAHALLRGEAGTIVELEVVSAGELPRTLRLVRQAIFVPSVLDVRLLDNQGVGYIRLVGFQKSTIQEMEDAILRLRTDGMRTLILDLRGNPGGLFKVAVQVAERFLSEGVIVSTQGQLRGYNRTYESHSGPNALDLPLVLLVDGDTASAAEVVAGALKENQRATLVGQTTYGKGSIQCVLQLSAAAGGLRVTLARFYSPRGNLYSGTGIAPHIIVDRGPLEMMSEMPTDHQLKTAQDVAAGLYSMRQ